MKNLPTYEQFINESIKFNPKPFDKVKPGDIAYTIGDKDQWEVVATGYGDEYDSKLKKYDESGSVYDMKKNPKSYGMSKSDFDNIEFIAIKNGNETMVFTYDNGGAWVNESKVNEANDEFVPATLIKDFEDLRKDQIIKINALDFTQGADRETVECIRPDGKKMEIKKAIIEVKI